MDVIHAVREEGRQHAQARTDLQDDIGPVELGQAVDHAEHVAVDQEVLAEGLLRSDAAHVGGSPKAVAAFSSIRRSSSSSVSLRVEARTASVCTMCIGSFLRPRTG